MKNNLGQEAGIWDAWWRNSTPVSEIQMWDYYGGRHWLCKYVPRIGKVVEAGCGLGRYVFYFSAMGIDIEGLDFAAENIEKLNTFKKQFPADVVFRQGDVTQMPYADNTLSGYISLGVVEHFVDGPDKALSEAYRVLRPGGIAIVTTPNVSFSQLYFMPKKKAKALLKKLLRYPPKPFFQYEYTPAALSRFMKKQGFHVSRSEGCDLFYAVREIVRNPNSKINKSSTLHSLLHFLEKTQISRLGAQSVTISVKPAPLMHCFLSGELEATMDSLQLFDVPISPKLQHTELASLFKKNRPVLFSRKYVIQPPVLPQEKRICSFTGKEYLTDAIFEDYGFSRNVAPDELVKPEINIELSAKNIYPVYRER